MNQGTEQTPIPERDLDEVLRSLEVELFGPPKARVRDDSRAGDVKTRPAE